MNRMSESKNEQSNPEFSATITFGEGREEGLAIVRRVGASVAVCLSLRANGDTEAVLDIQSARELADAIRAATDRPSQVK
jgi:hypothetical protein